MNKEDPFLLFLLALLLFLESANNSLEHVSSISILVLDWITRLRQFQLLPVLETTTRYPIQTRFKEKDSIIFPCFSFFVFNTSLTCYKIWFRILKWGGGGCLDLNWLKKGLMTLVWCESEGNNSIRRSDG